MSESRTESPWLGYPLERKEDFRLTTGSGRYIADLSVPGTLHLVFVRSAHAHARLLSIDVSKARALPGVVAVVTGEDIKDEIRPLPLPVRPAGVPSPLSNVLAACHRQGEVPRRTGCGRRR